MSIRETYQDKANRDKRFRELKAQGLNPRRSSHAGQNLHPMYVQDYGHAISAEDKGFGNTLYQTYFAHLYIVEVG